MGHDAVIVLIKKERAKNSFEARKFVLLMLEKELDKSIIGDNYEVYVGGSYSGLLSDACGEKAIVPYFDLEMRRIVRENILKIVPWLKEHINKSKEKKIAILPKDLKKEIPAVEKYNDSDLLDALRLELYDMKLAVKFAWHKTRDDIVYIFKYIDSSDPSPDRWSNKGRYEFAGLGYEDDAMILNECLYREIITEAYHFLDVIDFEKEKVIPENVLGNRWIVLVDKVD